MSMMRRSSPFGELLSLRQAMDRLFEDSYVRPRSSGGAEPEGFAIPLDIWTTGDALVLEAALPGVKPEDVDITVLGDTLTINASTRDEQRGEQGGYLYQEVRRGQSSRTVTLPADLRTDAATATFENGMLRLSIPKAAAAKPRQIRIGSAAGEQSAHVSGARQVGGTTADSGMQGGSSSDEDRTPTANG